MNDTLRYLDGSPIFLSSHTTGAPVTSLKCLSSDRLLPIDLRSIPKYRQCAQLGTYEACYENLIDKAMENQWGIR